MLPCILTHGCRWDRADEHEGPGREGEEALGAAAWMLAAMVLVLVPLALTTLRLLLLLCGFATRSQLGRAPLAQLLLLPAVAVLRAAMMGLMPAVALNGEVAAGHEAVAERLVQATCTGLGLE